jgi:hypothetical protein
MMMLLMFADVDVVVDVVVADDDDRSGFMSFKLFRIVREKEG